MKVQCQIKIQLICLFREDDLKRLHFAIFFICINYSIPVGKNNRYGHPNGNVLDNLEASKIYRTDQDGSIMFKIKNNKLKVETCAS